MARAPRGTKGVPEPPDLLDFGLTDDVLVEEEASFALPLVPIREAVYFPGMVFPLLLGRDRSVHALEAAVEGESRTLVLASQRTLVEDPEPDAIFEIGILAEVVSVGRLPDGMVRLSLEAGPRVRIARYLQTEPFLLVAVEPAGEVGVDGEDTEVEALTRTVIAEFERLIGEGKNIPPEALASVLAVKDPGRLADTVIPYLGLRVDAKQALLETLDVRVRLRALVDALYEEGRILEVQRDIRSRVEKEMGDHQREFLLREQLKAIQQELGEVDGVAAEILEYRERIDAAGMGAEVAERAHKELDRLARTPSSSPEATVSRNFLDWLLSLPWSVQTEDVLDLPQAEAILDSAHHGLRDPKERILDFLAVRKLAGSALKAPILCFVGPPGVGKTSLGRSVAEALGRKFHRISLGGVRDEAEIRGHRRTYVGALPGRIVQALKQAGSRNPVIVLDEIDKLGVDMRGDPSSALLEALDPEQNREFSDHYLEVPFDLSQVLFITTANLLDPIAPALRDRLEVIPFSGYVEAEKLVIAREHLVPRQRERHGLRDDQLALPIETLQRLVREYTREAGVRNLEREIGALCRKAARRIAGGEAEALSVAPCDLEALLGKPRYHWGVMEDSDSVGAATGLVYTEAGGDTVMVEVQTLPSSAPEAAPLLTGQLGEVMRESAQAAWTYVRSRLALLGLPDDAPSKRQIHVHVPAGAVPKDGPSAGVTMAVALASALSGRAVRRDVAMTGEITLRGRILPVGGIKEKVLAAHRAGIRTVLLPAENERDLDDLPGDVREALTFELLTHADRALALALVPK